MLREVTHYEMTAATRDRGGIDVVGGERRRKRAEQVPEGLERVEHLAVARRLHTPARDDVAPVRAMGAGGTNELSMSCERVVEGLPERDGLRSGEFVRATGDRNRHRTRSPSDRYLIARGFLDHERGNSKAYRPLGAART
ncbi:hypothetical protein C447_17112 [Halococcus hamelinensis 100A6]|uniref:Uncharacterized protein n=1 Tax=Halococcus hamelinensis 100A6 TaxID=1132509 RepID=M0LPW9_9EURY|nr:hypothetical protein C447_17112 [Halococcus hamelinensis 100A6]